MSDFLLSKTFRSKETIDKKFHELTITRNILRKEKAYS
jgi:hypothetical protein